MQRGDAGELGHDRGGTTPLGEVRDRSRAFGLLGLGAVGSSALVVVAGGALGVLVLEAVRVLEQA